MGLAHREGVSLETHTLRGSELGTDAVVLKQNGIVSRSSLLVCLVECRTPAVLWVFEPCRRSLHLAGYRHQGKASDLELVEARESVNGVVSILISYSLPALIVSISAVGGSSELGHSERH